MTASTNRPARTRCTGSKLPLAETVPSTSDRFHHYSATCPVCDRVFQLPHYALPVHYVVAECRHLDVSRELVCNVCGEDLKELIDQDVQAELVAAGELELTPLPIFSAPAVLVDAWNVARTLERCEYRGCIGAATFQVRREDVYDGFWKQACPTHLVAAVHEVGALAPAAAPHGPYQVSALAEHTHACDYRQGNDLPARHCCRAGDRFDDAELDAKTQTETVFASFRELAEAKGYTPTLMNAGLARAYDIVQERLGREQRAFPRVAVYHHANDRHGIVCTYPDCTGCATYGAAR